MKKKNVYQYDLVGRFLHEYISIAEAADELGINESSIRGAASGKKTKTSGGYFWSYEKKENFFDTNTISEYAVAHGVNPDDVVKARIYQTKDGGDMVSITYEKSKRSLSDKDIAAKELELKVGQEQMMRDKLRVYRKNVREGFRISNALEELNGKLIELLDNQTFKPQAYLHPESEGNILLVQVTDTHFNELVELPDNKYDFNVGSKRLQKYAHKIKMFSDIYKPSRIIVALTGDMINSDRRLDEKMYMATNRMKATIIATQILYHFIQDVNRLANVSVFSVSGNESRIDPEYGASEMVMSDNYDFLIYNMLKHLFYKADGIEFVDGDPVEQVINVNGSNILLTHGTGIKEGQRYMQQIFGKYAAKDIILKYAIFGHVHFVNVTDIYSRSGSLIGNNVYSDRGINLVTKASQILHVVDSVGDIDSIRVDLQNTHGYKGYDITEFEDAYNVQLADNTRQKKTIVRVVI